MQERLTIVRPAVLGAQLDAAVRRACTRPLSTAPDDLALLSARLACGDFETVCALVRAAPPAPALPLAVARYVAWSGDLYSAAAAWPAVLTALDDLLADTGSTTLRRPTCDELAATATDLGDAQLAARLHRHARRADRVARFAAPVDLDADLIRDVAHDVLGIEPDAPRGRLRLRPRLDRLSALEARHIRFSDGSVNIRATRDDAGVAIELEQAAGSIPLTVLLEPFVTAACAAEVDGAAANLKPQNVDGGLIVPVQLVLDDVRRLFVRARFP